MVRDPALAGRRADDRRAFSCSTATAGSTGNPVRAQNTDPLPLGGGQEERLEPAEVLRAVDGEVAGLELVAHLEEQRALPAAAVRHAVMADERLHRRRREVERRIGRDVRLYRVPIRWPRFADSGISIRIGVREAETEQAEAVDTDPR